MLQFSRLDWIKMFIDDLIEKYENQIWEDMSIDGYSDDEIRNSDEWKYRGSYLTYDDYDYGNRRIDEAIADFINGADIDEDLHIEHGVQQIVFVYDDIVYKITTFCVDEQINELKWELETNYNEEFSYLFPKYNFVNVYRDCYIYTQEKVTLKKREWDWYRRIEQEEGFKVPNMDYYSIQSGNCCAAIALRYGYDYLVELLRALDDIGFNYDIHNDNFGYNEDGDIRIFDPIYDEQYN